MDQFEIKKDFTNSFQRPINKEDVKYRKIQSVRFEKELKNLLDTDSCLCFHGTPIWNAKLIIETKKISDVNSDNKNPKEQNSSGMFYVTTINNLWLTIKCHSDLLNFKYPAGCIFVLEVENEQDLKLAREKNQIRNVDFNKTPGMLKAIITTPENLERVKLWIKDSGIKVETDIVMDFQGFLSCVKERNLEI